MVPCVNYYDNTFPPSCKYSAVRIPTDEVKLNLDPEFLSCCDCEDDCSDKTKCQCWQLTLDGAKLGNPQISPADVGYNYKRLLVQVPTGIYECNARCKCKQTCLNRVVQHSLQLKLQVFKTGNRGWGLRCLNDVPKGSFICCYAGQLLTDQQANESGRGDEYYADLDYIEVAQRIKEGYEAEADLDDEDKREDDFDPNGDDEEVSRRRRSNDSDDEFDPRAAGIEINTSIKKSYRTRTRVKQGELTKTTTTTVTQVTKTVQNAANGTNTNTANGDGSDEDDERQVISFMPHASSGANFEEDDEDEDGFRSDRRYFGYSERAYIMDAKTCGNIGRYFNVSVPE